MICRYRLAVLLNETYRVSIPGLYKTGDTLIVLYCPDRSASCMNPLYMIWNWATDKPDRKALISP
jgi:hypothetical protein